MHNAYLVFTLTTNYYGVGFELNIVFLQFEIDQLKKNSIHDILYALIKWVFLE